MKTENQQVKTNIYIIKQLQSDLEENQKNDNQNQVDSEEEEAQNKNLISIDNCDFESKTKRINSPRTLEALSVLGINENDLYKLSFEKFKNKYPEIKEIPKDLQKYRYDSYEQFINRTIEKVKEERKNIIDNQNGENENDENGENKKAKSNPQMEKIMKEQKETIEKIKNKQKKDIQGIIEAQ